MWQRSSCIWVIIAEICFVSQLGINASSECVSWSHTSQSMFKFYANFTQQRFLKFHKNYCYFVTGFTWTCNPVCMHQRLLFFLHLIGFSELINWKNCCSCKGSVNNLISNLITWLLKFLFYKVSLENLVVRIYMVTSTYYTYCIIGKKSGYWNWLDLWYRYREIMLYKKYEKTFLLKWKVCS